MTMRENCAQQLEESATLHPLQLVFQCRNPHRYADVVYTTHILYTIHTVQHIERMYDGRRSRFVFKIESKIERIASEREREKGRNRG